MRKSETKSIVSMKDLVTEAESNSLNEQQTFELFESFLSADEGVIAEDEIRRYLLASALRLPTAEELVGAARSLRAHMLQVHTNRRPLIDTCGTGGSGLSSFNASTAAALLVSSTGVSVAKHGNRSITSKCGSADVLEALQIPVSHSPASAAKALESTGFAFLFAPLFHPATKRVQTIRRSLGKRTIFNFLGPLCNPAGVTRQLLGVSDSAMLPVVAKALSLLHAEHALVVCGKEGLDEVSLAGPTDVIEIQNENSRTYTVRPEDFGLKLRHADEFSGAEPPQAAAMIEQLFAGKEDARSEFVALNAGAALYIAGKSTSWKEGVEQAQALLRRGEAAKTLDQMRTTQQ